MPPLNLTEAIAYSCNYYFGSLGERLNEPAFVSVLSEFGFGRKTGINADGESPGKLLRNGWRPQNAIGESDNFLATPIQIINAYSALMNGGHLLMPIVAGPSHFVPQPQANLTIKEDQREIIVKGMRGAVRYGTAETAGLYKLPGYIFGKTGTATQINGFRSQGWFIGFASDASEENDSRGGPERVKLAVLVFLARAHGSEAAEIARPIFEAFSQSQTQRLGDTVLASQHETDQRTDPSDSSSSNPAVSPSQRLIRLHLVRENVTQMIPLEDYVRSVVATEGSTENESESLKALAIATRTYAVKNMGRHERDGYDFCSTTHCQRFRPTGSQDTYIAPAVIEAVEATRGEILRDSGGNVANSYFSASCGGATANMSTLWGGSAPPYLRGVQDEYCVNEPHHSWTDVISQAHLLKALQSDRRTNVGGQLQNVTVVRRDHSERAELIALDGDRRVTISGWEFKIIVGRALGWNLLKSSRFEIVRSGTNFVFHGQGFGHGLGLCQEGAHVMALRGFSYRQILAKYFPTTRMAAIGPTGSADLIWDQETDREQLRRSQMFIDPQAKVGLQLRRSPMFPTTMQSHQPFRSYGAGQILLPLRSINITSLRDCWRGLQLFSINKKLRICFSENTNEHRSNRIASYASGRARQTLSSEDFRISYPATINRQEIDGLLSFLQRSRKSLLDRVAAAGLKPQLPSLEIFINETTGDFVGRTGQPPWAAAATKNNRIELQPFQTLRRRRILETTVRHELVHFLVDVLGGGRAPRWLAEGLAIHFAGEGPLVSRYQPRHEISMQEIEQKLVNPQSPADMRAAYAAAYAEVRSLIKREGETSIWRRVLNF